MERNWTHRYFIERADLFKIVMDSREMARRGKRLAEALARYLRLRGIPKGKVLDVGCGPGRVAIPLAKLGYDVIGIDISPSYIEIANSRVKEENLSGKAWFQICDAREMVKCLKDLAPFDVILFVWSTVLGYYDMKTDKEILRQALELAHRDTLLIVADTASKDFISFLSNFVGGFTWFTEYDDYVVVEHPIYNPVTGELLTKQTFYKKKNRDLIFLGEAYFKIRLYTLDELVSIAKEAGWCLIEALKSFASGETYRTLGALNVVMKPCTY